MPTRTTAAPAPRRPPAPTRRRSSCFRRPFAPGAIGFRAMSKIPYNGDPWGGAQVAAYIGAQSVVQRLNCVVPGRWRMDVRARSTATCSPPAPTADRRRRLYLACRLIVTLPAQARRPRRRRRLRGRRRARRRLARRPEGALLRRAQARRRRRRHRRLPVHRARRRRAADRPRRPPGPVHPPRRQERPARCSPPATEAWLRDGYRARMNTATVLRDLGPILAHGEPDDGIGQGESTDAAAHPGIEPPPPSTPPRRAAPRRRRANGHAGNGTGELVTIDFGGLGPDAAARGMSPARARLAALAAAAGYGPDTLALIADAALPAHRPGERLDDTLDRARRHRGRGARPVRLPAPTRSPTSSLTTATATATACWREQFWQRQLRTAALRYQPPALLRPLAVRGRPRRASPAPHPRARPRRSHAPPDPPRKGVAHDHHSPPPRRRPPARSTGAAELAARIQIPRRLPVRYDGQPLRHLSHSSYTQVPALPRRLAPPLPQGRTHAAERRACSSARRVDDALSTYYRQLLEHGEHAHARPAPRRLPRPLDARARRRTAPSAACAGTPSSTSRAPSRIGLEARRRSRCAELVPLLGRPVAVQRELDVRARARPRVDDPGLPRPRDAASRRGRRRAGPGDRRLQGQEHACTRRPRPTTTRRPASTSPAAGSPATPPQRVLLRPDRQARQAAQDDEHRASSPPAARPGSCAPCSRGSRRPPARSPRSTSATGPTSRGGSPTPAAGSARRATAPTTRAAPAAAGCEPTATGESDRRPPAADPRHHCPAGRRLASGPKARESHSVQTTR